MSATALEHDGRPTLLGGLAIVAAAVAVAAIAHDPEQLLAIGVAFLAAVTLWVGAELLHRGRVTDGTIVSAMGWLVLLTGVVGAVAALVLAATEPPRMSERVELIPGLLGVTVLTIGVLPIRDWVSRPRYLVGAGVGLVVVAVFTSGVVYGAETRAILLAAALAVVAWDAGEQAINLGEQVGRRGSTLAVGVVHVVASVGVGLVAVAVATLVHGVNVTGVPLLGLLALLGASILLALALYV